MSAQLSGEFPEQLALIGVQPALLDDYGGSLTPGIRKQLDPAVETACGILRDWGVAAQRRPAPLAADELVGPGALDIGDYEGNRPSIEVTPR